MGDSEFEGRVTPRRVLDTGSPATEAASERLNLALRLSMITFVASSPSRAPARCRCGFRLPRRLCPGCGAW